MEPGNETPQLLRQVLQCCIGLDNLAEGLSCQGKVAHRVAGKTRDAEYAGNLRTRNTPPLEFQCVVGKTLRIGIPGRRRYQPLAAKQLQIAAILQLQYLFAMQIELKHRGIGAQGKVGVVGKGLQWVASVSERRILARWKNHAHASIQDRSRRAACTCPLPIRTPLPA